MISTVSTIFLSSLLVSHAFDASEYTSKVELSDDYTLYHRVDDTTLYVALEVIAATPGYNIGFGFADPDGSGLSGADVVAASVDASGMVTAIDQYIEESPSDESATTDSRSRRNYFPREDKVQQDWVAVRGRVENGRTVVELSRLLNTWEASEDRIVGKGKVPIVWSFGDSVANGWGNDDVTDVEFIPNDDNDVDDDDDSENDDTYQPQQSTESSVYVDPDCTNCPDPESSADLQLDAIDPIGCAGAGGAACAGAVFLARRRKRSQDTANKELLDENKKNSTSGSEACGEECTEFESAVNPMFKSIRSSNGDEGSSSDPVVGQDDSGGISNV